jgi:amino acid transporter
MASSATDFGHQYEVKGAHIDEEKTPTFDGAHPRRSSTVGSVREVNDQTHRKLKSRHIQLIGIGGTIGTALYVQIGRGLMNGGPGSLFIAFTLWYVCDPIARYISNRKLSIHRCSVILAVTLSEITPFLKP